MHGLLAREQYEQGGVPEHLLLRFYSISRVIVSRKLFSAPATLFLTRHSVHARNSCGLDVEVEDFGIVGTRNFYTEI